MYVCICIVYVIFITFKIHLITKYILVVLKMIRILLHYIEHTLRVEHIFGSCIRV